VGEVASSLHGRGLMIWTAALATGLLCVWQHVRSSELALEIEALKGRRETVMTEIGILEMECAELSGRKRVEEYATERLGMRYPRAGEVIWIGPTDSEGPVVDLEGYVSREAACGTKG
jgi:cell division protein FtsL